MVKDIGNNKYSNQLARPSWDVVNPALDKPEKEE